MYPHPLHHLTCDEASAKAERLEPTTTTTAVAAQADISADGEALRACIALYESTSGLDPNWYQFTDETWATYGGKGSPSNAAYEEQTRIFWIAWADDGYHHWAAQKGRCF